MLEMAGEVSWDDAVVRKSAKAMSDQTIDAAQAEVFPKAPWLRRFPLLSPTLPPATHTNAYLLGERQLLLVDPGAKDPVENDRMLEIIDALRRDEHELHGIFLTHHHNDHMAGTAYLRARLGVPILAHPLTAERVEPRGLVVDRLVHEGDRLPYGPRGFTALLTPGHAPGHLCLYDEAGGGLIAGDMIASVGTILISPMDDGDMQIYLQSLERLVELGRAHLARTGETLRLWPAHGASIADGEPWLRFYIAHRLEREARVVAALRPEGQGLDVLWPIVYADKPGVPPPLAVMSLLAHLQKLLREGRAAERQGLWSLPV
jgi:ribonuclease/clavin/mitogillin